MAIPITTAAPAATHQIVFEDVRSSSVPAASAVLPESNESVFGFGVKPGGKVVFLCHVSQVLSAIARETDPRLMVRKQAVQRIATMDLIVVRRREPRMVCPLWKRHILVTNPPFCDIP